MIRFQALLVCGLLLAAQSLAAQTEDAGFTWKVADRFGLLKSNGVVEYHWNLLTEDYEPSWINPSTFPVVFDACTEAESPTGRSDLRSFAWQFADGSGSRLGRRTGHECRVSFDFEENSKSYTASLSITADGSVHEFGPLEIRVRDLLIVQIGDSYASGEGAPDLPRGDADYATWIDRRCHRSAKTGAAQAAIAIEQIDRYTSVTFLSYACSGATIETEIINDGGEREGSGLLAPYRGMDQPSLAIQRKFVPAQVSMLPAMRPIDALIIGAGGNDIRFAKIIKACAATLPGQSCRDDPDVTQVLAADLEALPSKYATLVRKLGGHAIKHVFFTEYPDPTADDSRATCEAMIDDILPIFWMSEKDADWASASVLTPINAIMRSAAEAAAAGASGGTRWHYVGGISEAFRGSRDGRGHGYCATDNWIMTATESAATQGPPADAAERALMVAAVAAPVVGVPALVAARLYMASQMTDNTGTMHPNAVGHRTVRDRLVEELARELFDAHVQCKQAPGIAFMEGGIKCMPTSDPNAKDCTVFENLFERQACGWEPRSPLEREGNPDDAGGQPARCAAMPPAPDESWKQVQSLAPVNAVGTIDVEWQRCVSETTNYTGTKDDPIISARQSATRNERYSAALRVGADRTTARVSASGTATDVLTEKAHTQCNNRPTTMTNVVNTQATHSGSATFDANVALARTAGGVLITIGVAEAPVVTRSVTSTHMTRACDQAPDTETKETTDEVKGGIEVGVVSTNPGAGANLTGSWTGPATNSIGEIGILTVTWNLRVLK